MNAERIPLIVGVTGHIALRHADLPRLRASVKAELQGLAARCPNTQLAMLTSLAAGGDLLCADVARLTDAEGVDKPFEKRRVSVRVEGAGVLQGFGSGDPQPTNGYDDTACDTWDGRVMAVVRSTHAPGDIRVTFRADGLDPVSVALRAE